MNCCGCFCLFLGILVGVAVVVGVILAIKKHRDDNDPQKQLERIVEGNVDGFQKLGSALSNSLTPKRYPDTFGGQVEKTWDEFSDWVNARFSRSIRERLIAEDEAERAKAA